MEYVSTYRQYEYAETVRLPALFPTIVNIYNETPRLIVLVNIHNKISI